MSRSHLRVVAVGDRLIDIDLPADRRDEAGSGWVRRLKHLLTLRLPERSVLVTDATEPVTTIHKQRERWLDDVLIEAPDVALVFLGISDGWGVHEGGNPYAKGPEEFCAILDDLLDRAARRCPQTRIILIEPFVNTIETSPQRFAPAAAAVARHAAAIRALAQRRGLTLVPAAELVLGAKRARDGEWLGMDPLGLDTIGHMVLAEAVAGLLAPAPGPTAFQSGQTVLFIGDSITDADRRDAARPWGRGYLKLLIGLQAAREPGKILRWINKGIGGDSIVDIEHRWQADVTAHRPDWLVLYTGINDLNTVYAGPKKVAVTPELYEAGLDRCLADARARLPGVRLGLVAPFFLSRDDHEGSYRHEVLTRLPGYAAAVRAVAGRHGARHLDLQEVLRPLMQRHGNRAFGAQGGRDIVHPSELGCLAIAEAMYGMLSA